MPLRCATIGSFAVGIGRHNDAGVMIVVEYTVQLDCTKHRLKFFQHHSTESSSGIALAASSS